MESLLRSGERSPPPDTPSRLQRRLATFVPWLLLLGFVVVSVLLFGDRLTPATPLAMETVVTLRSGEEAQGSGNLASSVETEAVDPWSSGLLFQASGWLEPEPFPVKATSLVDGVVSEVRVLEGAAVSQGQVLATLIREDFELDLAGAESALLAARSVSEANGREVAAAEAGIRTLRKQVEAAHAKLRELEDRRDRLASLPKGAASEEDVVQARLQVETHRLEVASLEATGAEREADVARLKAIGASLEAEVEKATTEVGRRKLALERSEIRSPIDGVILKVFAVPGQKRMLGMDDPDSSSIASLYHPGQLQARIDVPLDEAAQIREGQAVRIRTNFLPDRIFKGIVIQIAGEADLQRNTLQAKVRVEEPDPRLRPEMLCRAEFLASLATGENPSDRAGDSSDLETASAHGGRVSVWVGESALVDRSGDAASVWTLDASGERLEKRPVGLGRDRREGYIAVREGLRPGDRVAVFPEESLEEGQRVKPFHP